MKKFISLLLCLLTIVPLMAFNIGAATNDMEDVIDGKEPLTNVAKNGSTYATSIWNNDSQHRFINDGVKDSFYQFWRPSQASFGSGIKQHCGIKFKQYYEIHSLSMYAQFLSSGVTYTVEALVDGKWVQVAKFNHTNFDRSVPTYQVSGLTYAVYNIPFETPVNTKNIRIVCTDYTIAWEPPIIQEVELYGRLGHTPQYDLPDGAILSKNACLGAMLQASSTTYQFPAAYAADTESEADDGIAASTSQKIWKSQAKTNGESITATFEKEFNISHVSLNFGFLDGAWEYVFDVQLCVDGVWIYAANGVRWTTSTGKQTSWQKKLDNVVKASAMKVTFTSTNGNLAELNEMGATIADDEKAIFLNDYLTDDRIASIAGGNLAPYGTAYASSSFSFASIAEEFYINDGENADTSASWIAGTMAAGEYCGVTLTNTQAIKKIVLYFNNNAYVNDGAGTHIMSFDVMAKINGQFVKIAEGTSYDTNTKKYQVAIELDEAIETNDVRIVFTSNGQLYPYLTELELYAANNWKYPSYDGYPTLRSPLSTTKSFGEKSIVTRAGLLDKFAPVYEMEALLANAAMAKYVK